jgi:hypothetical protein
MVREGLGHPVTSQYSVNGDQTLITYRSNLPMER